MNSITFVLMGHGVKLVKYVKSVNIVEYEINKKYEKFLWVIMGHYVFILI